jgi:hypothetical protein
MLKIICVGLVALLIVGCAARHAPRVSCSGRLEEINPPQLRSGPAPAESAPKDSAP